MWRSIYPTPGWGKGMVLSSEGFEVQGCSSLLREKPSLGILAALFNLEVQVDLVSRFYSGELGLLSRL